VDKYEVPWAKGEITERLSGKFAVPWTGLKRDLDIDELLKFYEELRGPHTIEEWRDIEDYMGLFEHCEAMLSNELIDLPTFKEIYRYRLINIMSNRRIVIAKLGCKRESWQGFMRLLNMVDIEAPPEKNLTVKKLCDREVFTGATSTFGA
jgi:hypothetical protein